VASNEDRGPKSDGGKAGGGDNMPPHGTHYPISVIGSGKPQDEERMPSGCHELTITSAARTTPHRLSAVSGEKMNQFADFRNRKSKFETRKPQIINYHSLKHPMAK
jgi:hypothetical protein